MRKTIIVLIALAVAALFFWQFFVPTPSPASAGYTPPSEAPTVGEVVQ